MASMLTRGASRLSRQQHTGWISAFGRSAVRGFAATSDDAKPDGGGCEPTFKGAYCESVDVELGTERTPVRVGFETGRVARLTDGAIVASRLEGDLRGGVLARREPGRGIFPSECGLP
jgi:hypothetical protein